MKKVRGTVVSFVPHPYQAVARIDNNRKVLLLIDGARKLVDDSWRKFAEGEQLPVPTPSTKVVMDIPTNGGKKLTAAKWATVGP